jgi:hypothetical protein
MGHDTISVRRLPIRLEPDRRRTITRFFWPGKERGQRIIRRIEQMDPAHISELANNILQQFTPGNPGLAEILIEHYEQAIQQAGEPFKDDFEIKLLTGAYFSMEYAFESAALFNPSMVPRIDQPDLAEGRLHFVMSLRTVGEGHVSSITFRSGTIEDDGSVHITPGDLEVHQLKRKENQTFKKAAFIDKLSDLDIWNLQAQLAMNSLPDSFSTFQLQHTLERAKRTTDSSILDSRTLDLMLWILRSEYEIENRGSEKIENRAKPNHRAWKICDWSNLRTMTISFVTMAPTPPLTEPVFCRKSSRWFRKNMRRFAPSTEPVPRIRGWPCFLKKSRANSPPSVEPTVKICFCLNRMKLTTGMKPSRSSSQNMIGSLSRSGIAAALF